jgi:DNA-3-methyladenine glycosylase I
VRCFGEGDPLMSEYHDREWGRPVLDDAALFEKLCLEAMQSGLSWTLILRKREEMRDAFDGFDPVAVARYGERDVDRLLGDARVIRNRRKLEAIVVNAKATLALRESDRPLDRLLWDARPEPRPAPAAWDQVPAATEESKQLAKELKRAGFVFVGPTTVYSTMQAVGIVNDHLADCPVRADVEREQAAVARLP